MRDQSRTEAVISLAARGLSDTRTSAAASRARGQHEELVEGAWAVGEPDAGVLGVQPSVPAEQLPDNRF